jgi:hypothetical protein
MVIEDDVIIGRVSQTAVWSVGVACNALFTASGLQVPVDGARRDIARPAPVGTTMFPQIFELHPSIAMA